MQPSLLFACSDDRMLEAARQAVATLGLSWLKVRYLLTGMPETYLSKGADQTSLIVAANRVGRNRWQSLLARTQGPSREDQETITLLFDMAGSTWGSVICLDMTHPSTGPMLRHALGRRWTTAAMDHGGGSSFVAAGRIPMPDFIGVSGVDSAQSLYFQGGVSPDQIIPCPANPDLDLSWLVQRVLEATLPEHELAPLAKKQSGLPGVSRYITGMRCARLYGTGLAQALTFRSTLNAIGAPPGRVTILTHEADIRFGLARPPWYYANLVTHLGLREVEILEIAPDTDLLDLAEHLSGSRFVIANSIGVFSIARNAYQLAERLGFDRFVPYLHETGYSLDSFERGEPENYAEMARILARCPVLCASLQHARLLKNRFRVEKSFVIYNSSFPGLAHRPPMRNPAPLAGRPRIRIAMAGTVQGRKGPSLFSRTADLAVQRGLDYEFIWLGTSGTFSTGIYKSPNVSWHDQFLSDADFLRFLMSIDIFLLASSDDPFPLVVTEAIEAFCRTIVYKDTGPAELLTNVGGCDVFSTYDEQAVLDSIEKVIATPLDIQAYQHRQSVMSPANFVYSIEQALKSIGGVS